MVKTVSKTEVKQGKITEEKANPPEDKKEYNWGYTLTEGGLIREFDYPKDEAHIARAEAEVTKASHWGTHPSNVYGKGDRSYTKISFVPGPSIIKVHSVFFPDGRIWDSTLRRFDNRRKASGESEG